VGDRRTEPPAPIGYDMKPPRPPRDDDATPPDKPRRSTNPIGVPVVTSRDFREVTPRSIPIVRDQRRRRDTPAHILKALGRSESAPLYIEDEKTPVRLILAVREELKDDIEPLKALPEAVAKLTGEVSVTNKLMPVMLETIRTELQARRAEDHVVVTTKLDVERHRAVTDIDSEAANQATKRKVWLRIAGLLTSVSLATTIITLLAARC
jgi:hypothetical protein